uniref:Uncharacterized protein n=1 Tax=Moniliophthora roreri TaxID=221103 RepID=A0A0W0FU87_MONRR
MTSGTWSLSTEGGRDVKKQRILQPGGLDLKI